MVVVVVVICVVLRVRVNVKWFVGVGEVCGWKTFVSDGLPSAGPASASVSRRSCPMRASSAARRTRHSRFLPVSLAIVDYNSWQLKPGIERVQALADISRSALCCHSNEIHAPIANLPNSVQLEGTPCHSPKLHLGTCSSVGMRWGTDRHRPPWPIL